MRYVSNAQIKEGMMLAMPYYGPNFEIMLGAGMVLTANHIKRLNELGYQGAYIEDEISKDLKPSHIIPTEQRISTIRAAKEFLQQAEKGGSAFKITRETQNRIIMPVIRAIMDNKERMIDMVDLKPFDDYMYYHTAQVVILSLLIGVELGMTEPKLFELGMSTLLHDVGNMFIPKSILNKPGALTPEEFEIIKSHSQMGFNYLREHFDLSIEACMGALQHHENYDGTGYPVGLRKDRISIYGRIIAVTDVYDALTSRRPFRQPVCPAATMDFMEASSGTKFDPEILETLKRVVARYPLGSFVELDTGAEGIVVKNYIGDTARPKVRILDDSPFELYLDLHADRVCANVSITEIIDW